MEEQKALADLQRKLAAQVNIPSTGGYQPKEGDVVLGLDIQYSGDEAHVAGDIERFHGEHIGTFAGITKSYVPYVPSYFCFREGPPLLALIARLAKEALPLPDVIVVDGHGIAHPRKFGVGCWLGIATGKPTMGAAKETLLHYEGELAPPRGSKVKVMLEQEVVGYVVRTQDSVRPIYVSPGHMLSLDTSARLALELAPSFRIPEILRRADHAARSHSKGLAEAAWHNLGALENVAAAWEK
jgi:deoxyribonuclease V